MSKRRCFFTLYRFELLKILKNRVAIVTFLIFFVFAFIQGEFEISGNIEPADLAEYQMNDGREINDEYIAELKSRTDEDGEFTTDDDKAYRELKNWIDDIYEYKADYTELDAAKVYDRRIAEMEESFEDEQLSDGEIAFWRDKETEVQKPVKMYCNWVPSGILEGTTNFSIYMIILVATGLAMIFSMETQRKTDPMIRATINGNAKLYFAKVLAGFSYVMTCLLLIVVGFLTYLGLRWGFSGMNAAVQVYWPLAAENMSLWKLEGIIIVMLVVFALLLSAFALFVSNLTRNGVATMAIVIGGCLGMFALSTSIPMEHRFVSQIVQLLSPSVISSRLVYEFRLINMGKYFTVYEFVPMLYIFLSVLLIVMGYFIYRKYEIKNS